jgi:hypothetical protein
MNWEPTSWANYELVREGDVALLREYDKWLDLLETEPQSASLRRNRLSVGAWLIRVRVPGRDQEYAIIWNEFEGMVDIHHLGPWNPSV